MVRRGQWKIWMKTQPVKKSPVNNSHVETQPEKIPHTETQTAHEPIR